LQRITSRNHSSSITTIHTSIGTDRLYFIRNRWDRIETIVRHTAIINTGQTRGLSIAVDIGSKESVFLLKEVGIRDRKFGVSIEAVDPKSLTNCIRLSMYRNLHHINQPKEGYATKMMEFQRLYNQHWLGTLEINWTWRTSHLSFRRNGWTEDSISPSQDVHKIRIFALIC